MNRLEWIEDKEEDKLATELSDWLTLAEFQIV